MKRILVSAHDPGGAQAVAPVVRALRVRGDDVLVLATGPALQLFRSLQIECSEAEGMSREEIFRTIDQYAPDVYVFGTSGGETLEKLLVPRLHGSVPAVAVLDFWSNYAARFSRQPGDLAYLPDRICVMDEEARAGMQKEGFPDASVVVTGNPYFETFAPSTQKPSPDELLFISQPIRETRGAGFTDYGFDEYSTLEEVLAGLHSLPPRYTLWIRLHPKDEPHKYDSYLSPRVALSNASTLEEAIDRAGLVIGMFSPVLIEAAVRGRPVLSVQIGRTAPDPLPTNRSGVTYPAYDAATLVKRMAEYAEGALPLPDAATHWPPGAADRIIAVLDELS